MSASADDVFDTAVSRSYCHIVDSRLNKGSVVCIVEYTKVEYYVTVVIPS